MKTKTFNLTSEYIELIKLLKFMGIAESGSHAKQMVEEGEVKLNGAVEYRKRAKLRPKDKIEIQGWQVEIE